MHDPRGAHGYGLSYAVSARGACHMAGLGYPVEGGGMYLPEIEAFRDELQGMDSRGKAQLNVACQDYGVFFGNCAIFCNLGAMVLNASQAVATVNHVTGHDYTLAEVMQKGRRIWHTQRGLSNLFGARAADDRLPARLMTPLASGPSEGSVPDMELMLKEFYHLRGIKADGIAARSVLADLGLNDLAALLDPAETD